MKKHLLVTLLLLISGFAVHAQLKKLSLSDAVLKQRTALAPKRLNQIQWISGTSDFSFTDTIAGRDLLMKGNAVAEGRMELLALSDINSLLKANNADSLSRWPAIKWQNSDTFSFDSGKKRWLFSFSGRSLVISDSLTIPDEADVQEVSKTGAIAYVAGNNIWIEEEHQRKQITTDGSYTLVYGKSVHREEFGIEKGLFWSPDGSKLAFYRMDQSPVKDYPIVDFSDRPAANENIKYPMAGDSSHRVTLGVYDLKSGTTIYLNTGLPAEQYLTNITWNPDGKSIFIAVVNREQNHMWLNRYSSSTGAFEKTLFEETDAKYTEPLHPMYFVKDQGAMFIWQSRRDGWNHLYLYDSKGMLIRQLTKGEWEVTDFNGFNQKGSKAYFHATSNLGINRDFYSVTLATAKLTRLTTEDGVHACVLNDQYDYFIDNYSSLTVPRVIDVKSTDGKFSRNLLRADNPLKEYSAGSTSLFNITAADKKTPLWCRMILPAAFDSTKKYPVIVYVYGGPHAQMITNSWLGGADMWFHYLSQQGYIVFTVDNRGSSNRGKEFEQATFRHLGDEEMKDQMEGVKYLRTLPYIDDSRIGVNGWSFGGFMTTSLMTRYPGVFKAGVAGGPVIDWSYYEIMYTERYMDTPLENPEGFRISNLTNYVDQLNGRLMLIHGASDNVVVWQHSLMYLKKAVSKGVQLDYFVYPGHLHNVTGKDRVHLNEKITRYFDDFLK